LLEELKSKIPARPAGHEHGWVYDDYCASIKESLKRGLKNFFRYVDLKKKRVEYPSVMNLKAQSASGAKKMCDFFADFIKRTYAVGSGPGLDFVTIIEVESALLDLNDS
jgi:hypothetical protein